MEKLINLKDIEIMFIKLTNTELLKSAKSIQFRSIKNGEIKFEIKLDYERDVKKGKNKIVDEIILDKFFTKIKEENYMIYNSVELMDIKNILKINKEVSIFEVIKDSTKSLIIFSYKNIIEDVWQVKEKLLKIKDFYGFEDILILDYTFMRLGSLSCISGLIFNSIMNENKIISINNFNEESSCNIINEKIYCPDHYLNTYKTFGDSLEIFQKYIKKRGYIINPVSNLQKIELNKILPLTYTMKDFFVLNKGENKILVIFTPLFMYPKHTLIDVKKEEKALLNFKNDYKIKDIILVNNIGMHYGKYNLNLSEKIKIKLKNILTLN